MAERYKKLFLLQENLYSKGCPLIICAGRLSLDTQTGNVIAQLKFKNISTLKIKAVKVCIDCYDIENIQIQGVEEHQYLDLNQGKNSCFGQDKAIILPNNNTRSFAVKISYVLLEDETIWKQKNATIWESLSHQVNLIEKLDKTDLVHQFQIETTSESKYIPLETPYFWFCSCGAVNKNDEIKCNECKIELSILKEKLEDEDMLSRMKKRLDGELKQKAIAVEKEKKIQKNIHTKRRNKAIGVSILLLILIIIVVLVISLQDKSSKDFCIKSGCTNYATSGSIYCITHKSSMDFCAWSSCTNYATSDSVYCITHKSSMDFCIKSGCTNYATSGSVYCITHKSSTTNKCKDCGKAIEANRTWCNTCLYKY